jgi:hypothetical protein
MLFHAQRFPADRPDDSALRHEFEFIAKQAEIGGGSQIFRLRCLYGQIRRPPQFDRQTDRPDSGLLIVEAFTG